MEPILEGTPRMVVLFSFRQPLTCFRLLGPVEVLEVIDTQRISEVGIAKLCSTLSEEGTGLRLGRSPYASFLVVVVEKLMALV